MGFYGGKTSKNIDNFDKFALFLEDFQLDIQHFEHELVKKTGIQMRAKNLQAAKTEQAFVKGEALLKQGNMTHAGLYFSNGMSQEPGNWEKIRRYQQTVLDYCQQLIDNGNYQTALNVLDEMEVFIRSQALYVPVQDIDKLQQALIGIAQTKQTVTEKMIAANHSETAQLIKELLDQSDELLAYQPPNGQPELITQHQESLRNLLFSWQSVDFSVLTEKDREYSEISDKMTQLENAITTIDQQQATAQATKTVVALVHRAEQFLEKAAAESAQSNLTLYYLSSVDSIIRQLVLLVPEVETAITQLSTLSMQLEQTKETIAKRQSQLVWDEIEQTVEQSKIPENSTAQEAIEQFTKLRQFISEKFAQLSSVEFVEKAQALSEKVNSQLTDWQHQQLHQYERWAIARLNEFYNEYQNELGMRSDEDKIYAGLINYLGNIDNRYLSSPAQRAYNEVFQKFYVELRDDQKIPLSSQMSLMNKKPLSNF